MTTELPSVTDQPRRIVLVGWPADRVPDLSPHQPLVIGEDLTSILANATALLSSDLVVFYPSNSILRATPARKDSAVPISAAHVEEGLEVLRKLIALPFGENNVIVFLPEQIDESDTSIWRRWFGLSFTTRPRPFPFSIYYPDTKAISQLYRSYAHLWVDRMPGADKPALVMADRHVHSLIAPEDGLCRTLAESDTARGEVDLEKQFRVVPLEGSHVFCCAVRIQKNTLNTYLFPAFPDSNLFVVNVVRMLFHYGLSTVAPGDDINDPFENEWARERVESLMRGPNPIVGNSAAILSIYPGLLDAIDSPRVPVLIFGPIGSGKEVVFEALRRLHPSDADLMVVDVAGLDPSTVISLLFGHERGAYTGAIGKRKGAVEAVGDGTLVIDNFQNVSLTTQAKILRLLESKGEFQRFNSEKVHHSRARIAIAMNIKPSALITSGGFLPDLLSRFAITINVPPLNDRRQDIPLLVDAFANAYLAKAGWSHLARMMLSPKFMLDAWMVRDWDDHLGNVRGLKNEVERFIRQEHRNYQRETEEPVAPSAMTDSPMPPHPGGTNRRRGRKEGPNILDETLRSIIDAAVADPANHDIRWVVQQIQLGKIRGRRHSSHNTQRAIIARVRRMAAPESTREAYVEALRKIRGFPDLTPKRRP
jgi:DNA-binding NtrC family response regulator